MTRPNHVHTRTLLAIAAMLIVGFGANGFAANVDLTITLPEYAVALGGTGTAKVGVKINDGSTLQSITWTQTSGLTATLANANTDTVTVTVPNDRSGFKHALIEAIKEPPTETLPPYIPLPEPYTGGLQNRYTVAAVSPFALEEAWIGLQAAVVTSSGTYKTSGFVKTLPWTTATGNRNVPLNAPVLLQGKSQASYDWTLTPPTSSKATLIDATSQNPDFTPDIAGTYKLTVTDIASNKAVTFDVHAGTWKGVITGQDSNGRPVADVACVTCHVPNTPHFDMFTPWAKSGHAEIFTQNVEAAGHYGQDCLSCHTVGFDKPYKYANNGIDEQSDWEAFAASGLLEHGATGNWGKILTQFPKTARMANIQCENCHGPQDSVAHMKKDGSRQTLSSDLCGSCHGEPARHGRFQQWQLSGHANMETAEAEGTTAGCAKCHSAQGFLQWQDKGFSTPVTITVDWTTDEVQPQSCAVCHDTHNVGNVTGEATDAHLRVEGDTPMLDAGFKATNMGKAALCITCHNGRRGLRDDNQTFNVADAARAPHVGPQGDMLMGQNLYFTKVGQRGFHAMIKDSCVTCHMVKTDPPADLSYQLGGTNHTFFASKTICASCHTKVTAEAIQGEVHEKLETLKAQIETAILNYMQGTIRAGNILDLNGTKVKVASDVKSVEFIESHGSQGVTVTLANGTKLADMTLAASSKVVNVIRPNGASVPFYTTVDTNLAKAGFNFFSVESDASAGVHNPAFINSGLDVAISLVKSINTTLTTPPSSQTPGAAIGGGLGNGAGAVSCTTPYVYWAEIVAHAGGAASSQWRTDIIARNLSTSNAALKFILHQSSGNIEGNGAVSGSSQKAFEDIVATLGGGDLKGSLEICSDQPLLVAGRIFNQDATGTYGQGIEGHVADLGYGVGQTISLIGLRQKADAFRTNISVTNAGNTEAQVSISLYDATGTALTSYNLTIPAGQVAQDTEPFIGRANAPNVGWGFATVTVLKGTNIRTSASVIDMKTNDPTTIMAKQ